MNGGKRTRNIFDPKSEEPYKLSRTKIENFVRCPLCFYLDVRLGVSQPPGYPFTLNSAVDNLLKKEFDIHRAKGAAHPLMSHYGIDAVPYKHKDLDIWRENFRGLDYFHEPTNFRITGAIDDVWAARNGDLHVVDYKATSKDAEVTLDAEWQDGYKRQMEIYQWLFRQNGFAVSNTGYFVYANGRKDKKAFDGKLEFDVKIIPYIGDDGWVEETLIFAKKTLMSNVPPDGNQECRYCNYRDAAFSELKCSS